MEETVLKYASAMDRFPVIISLENVDAFPVESTVIIVFSSISLFIFQDILAKIATMYA